MSGYDYSPIVQALIGLAAGAITILSGFALKCLRMYLENTRINRVLSAAHNGMSLAVREGERLGFGDDIDAAEKWMVERGIAYMLGGKAGKAVKALGYTPERLREMAGVALAQLRQPAGPAPTALR